MRLPERTSHARALPASDDASLTLGRRLGVLVVLAVLAGAIVLAASGGGGRRDAGIVVTPTSAVAVDATAAPVSDPAATLVPPVGAPTGTASFIEPKSTLVNRRRVDLRVRVPDPGVPWDGLEVRVLRGGTELAAKRIAPDDVNSKGRLTIKDVPLKRGTNKLTVVLANPTGAGPASDTLTMRLDDRPPRLKVTAPKAGIAINQDTVTVRGRTVAGQRVVVRNMTTDQKVEAIADGQGRFEADLRLRRGRATLKVAASDAAGNTAVEQLAIVRGNGKPEARLRISRESFKRSKLPRHLDARVSVLDADGRPVKGAEVVFTIAPPGPPIQMRETTTSKDGVATWSGFRVVEGTVTGEGYVTVQVTLPNGRKLDDTVTFRVR